jgi:hypothetical protein
MARSATIVEPTKLTLYISRKISEPAKDYAAQEGKSLSQVVSELLTTAISGKVTHQVQLDHETSTAIQSIAYREHRSVSDIVEELVEGRLKNTTHDFDE